MADILVKNMEMPKSCEDCPFTKKVCDIYFTDKKTGVKTPYHYVDSCSLTGSWFDPFSDDSPKPCPLVALPSHGDLKDSNAILRWLNAKADNRVPVTVGEIIDFIEKQPTVLEASE